MHTLMLRRHSVSQIGSLYSKMLYTKCVKTCIHQFELSNANIVYNLIYQSIPNNQADAKYIVLKAFERSRKNLHFKK